MKSIENRSIGRQRSPACKRGCVSGAVSALPSRPKTSAVNVWTLTAEVFGLLGRAETAPETQPRLQAGLRWRPIDRFSMDFIYGRNITGENANWITIATSIRFPAPEK